MIFDGVKHTRLREKLWFKIFINIGVIFAVFVLILALSNITFMVRFYSMKQKKALVSQMNIVETLDISDQVSVTQTLSDISDKYNFEIEIYNSNGNIIYTTYGNQMMDYFTHGKENFKMQHEKLISIESERLADGSVLQTARQVVGNKEFLLCTKQIENGIYAEIRIQKELITASAQIANEFITIVAVICFVLSIVWVFWFSRRFAKPISDMSEITRSMSSLDFSRKLKVESRDEIGQLSVSINEMSDSLSKALNELQFANENLKGEIEAERQLDVMRKAFVANVSHELKTPISIISGYAEGLKLNINSASREEYCNIIIDESRRMNELVLSILTLSKYESGQIPIECHEFSVAEMVKPILQRIFSGKDINVSAQIDQSITVFADPMQTEQALRAYLENAVAHTPKGGSVSVTAQPVNGNVRISVFNSGSLVTKEQMPQIWQSFFRGDTSHHRENTRFGLGLSIVSAICRCHGTDCGVYNTDNGVCFWLDLPVKE